MDVIFAVGGKIVVDDERHLLHIDSTSQKISSDQNTRRTGSELFHDQVTLALIHVAVHRRHGEVTTGELLGEPINLSPRIAENDCLSDGNSLVEIGQCVKFPIFLLNRNVELLDTFEGELSLLDKDPNGVTHKLRGDFKNILGHGSGEEDHLGGLWEELEDVVNLLGETALSHSEYSSDEKQTT